MTLKIRKVTLVTPVTGVAPGQQYNPTIELLFDDENDPTMKLAALNAQLAAMTEKLPVLVFEREAVAI